MALIVLLVSNINIPSDVLMEDRIEEKKDNIR